MLIRVNLSRISHGGLLTSIDLLSLLEDKRCYNVLVNNMETLVGLLQVKDTLFSSHNREVLISR